MYPPEGRLARLNLERMLIDREGFKATVNSCASDMCTGFIRKGNLIQRKWEDGKFEG